MKYASFIILFLLVYLLMFRPLRKRLFQTMSVAELNPAQQGRQLAPDTQAKALAGATQSEELAHQADQVSSGGGLTGEPPSLKAVDDQIERELMKEADLVNLGNRKFGALKKKLMEKAKKDPEIVSQLIRSWMQEKA